MKKNILVIDDEESIRKVLKLFLEKEGNFKVIEAKNGREGFEMFQKYKPEIIITDLNLPLMRGEELTRNIKKIANPTIICMSGETYLKPVAKAAGCDLFLEKPFNILELEKIINEKN